MKGKIDPKVDKKNDIFGTPLQKNLNLKLHCRVMLTYNLDVCDSLTNGSQGEVIGFEYEQSGNIKYVLVKFDDDESGQELRKQFKNQKYTEEKITPIGIMEFNYSLSRSKYASGSSSTATALQFPLRLAYAATAHKIQGHTVKKPSSLIVDLNAWLQPAMAYVMLSQIQCLTQLIILNSIPEKKLVPWPSSLQELERLNEVCRNNFPVEKHELKVASLNTYSLKKHYEDVKFDPHLVSSDVICLKKHC